MKNFKLTNGFRSYLIEQIKEMDLSEPKRVNIDEWKGNRGLPANALSWVWYKIIGDEIGMTTDEVHNDSKIKFGLPILFQSGSDYAYSVTRLLEGVRFFELSQENQWRAISPIAVTSKFNTKEMSEYLESIQRFYGIQGIKLESE